MAQSKIDFPAISVVLPVFNSEQYIVPAVISILNQTFCDFEFIIVDDHSNDKSGDIICSFIDSRIKLISNPKNSGNYRCRNQGFQISKGRYICVMDADDISEPQRLERQYQFMEEHQDVGICGTFIRKIPSNFTPNFITDPELLKVAFLSNNFCSHPSLMMRKSFLEEHNLSYNEDYLYSADFDLCARAQRFTKIQNIPEILLQYRVHESQISSAKFIEQQQFADIIRINQLVEIFGFDLNEIPVLLHLKLMKKQPLNPPYLKPAREWICQILARNTKINYFNQEFLKKFIFNHLFYCLNSKLVNGPDAKL